MNSVFALDSTANKIIYCDIMLTVVFFIGFIIS